MGFFSAFMLKNGDEIRIKSELTLIYSTSDPKLLTTFNTDFSSQSWLTIIGNSSFDLRYLENIKISVVSTIKTHFNNLFS